MSARKPKDLRPILPPPAFRGNCDCGRWLIVLHSFGKDNPLECECGLSWYWLTGELCRVGQSNTKEHLGYKALKLQNARHMLEMKELVDVILAHGGPKFPVLTFNTPAEAVDALVRWIKDDDDPGPALALGYDPVDSEH
jgi:hypothetical protein